MSESAVTEPLPIGGTGRKAGGWYGMLALIVTEGSLFLYLLFSYYYFALWGGGRFVPDPLPKFDLAGPDTAILLLSSAAVWWGERGARRSSRAQTMTGLGLTVALGAVFVGVQLVEWAQKPFHFNQTSYSALYFTITGFHMAHVVVGLVVLLVLLLWTRLGYFDARRDVPITVGSIYWHFVDAVWLAVFFTIYVTPHLGVR
jgi:heme/copper-type cytochrome/quinol oxidase subunit 3